MFNGSMFNGSMFNGSMFNGSMFNGSMFNGSMFNGSMFNGSMFLSPSRKVYRRSWKVVEGAGRFWKVTPPHLSSAPTCFLNQPWVSRRPRPRPLKIALFRCEKRVMMRKTAHSTHKRKRERRTRIIESINRDEEPED